IFPRSALEAAEQKGIVLVERTRRRVCVQISHPLYGEVVCQRCPEFRARAAYRQIASALESTGARRRHDPLRLAIARLSGGEGGPPDLFLVGARLALASADRALGERLARAAVDAGAGAPARLL